MKQSYLSENTGIGSGRISEYVNGKRIPTQEVQERIASVFEMDLPQFLSMGRPIVEGNKNSVPDYVPAWILDILPALGSLDKNGQKAVKAVVEAFRVK